MSIKKKRNPNDKRLNLLSLALVLAIAGGLSLLASSHPDGLERVLEDHASDEAIEMPSPAEPKPAPMPDYTLPALGFGPLSTATAGILGALCTLGVLTGLVLLLRGRQRG